MRVEFFVAGMKTQWDECGGRILLDVDTSCRALCRGLSGSTVLGCRLQLDCLVWILLTVCILNSDLLKFPLALDTWTLLLCESGIAVVMMVCLQCRHVLKWPTSASFSLSDCISVLNVCRYSVHYYSCINQQMQLMKLFVYLYFVFCSLHPHVSVISVTIFRVSYGRNSRSTVGII